MWRPLRPAPARMHAAWLATVPLRCGFDQLGIERPVQAKEQVKQSHTVYRQVPGGALEAALKRPDAAGLLEGAAAQRRR